MIRYSHFVKPGLTMIVLAALALLVTACSPSAAKLTSAGNEAFAKQAYEEALQAYAEAQVKSPELAEPTYNLANVLYREGQYAEALKALQQAAHIAQTGQVAQNSHFNAGNAAFNAQSWEAAIESYRQALLRNPADLDAKHNLELALQQMQQQQEQQQNPDQQNQDQQDQDQQNQDQSQDGQGQQDQQNQDQQQGQQDQQKQSKDDQGQQDQAPGEQGQQERADQSQDGQQGQDQRGEQAQGQPQAGEEQDGQPRSGSQLAPGQRMTQEQARQLLAAIAAKSDTLQERLGQYLRVRGRPPVQDW